MTGGGVWNPWSELEVWGSWLLVLAAADAAMVDDTCEDDGGWAV